MEKTKIYLIGLLTVLIFMNIFNLSKIIYDLVHFDGPHKTKDVLRESIWFAERSRKKQDLYLMILTYECNQVIRS